MMMMFSNILKASSKRFKVAFGRTIVNKTNSSSLPEESMARYCPGGYYPVRIATFGTTADTKSLARLGMASIPLSC